MPTPPAQDFVQFLRKQLERKGRGGPCVAFVLVHVGAGKQQLGVIERVDVPKAALDKPGEFALTAAPWLFDAAERDARALTGVQTYSVGACFEQDPDVPATRHTFRVKAEPEETSLDPSVSEPATAEGHLGQLMRHTEALMKMATVGSQRTVDNLLVQLQKKDELLDRYQTRELQRVRQAEAALSEQQDRDLAREVVGAQERRKDALVDMLLPLVPVVAKKMTGVKLLPGGVKEGDGLKALFGSISESQMEKLMEIFTPTQLAGLWSIFEELKKTDAPPEAPHQ